MLFKEISTCFNNIENTSSRLEMSDFLAELLEKIHSDEIKKIVYLIQGKIAPTFEGKEIGFGEKLVAEAITKSTGYTREEVDKKFNELGDIGETVELLLEKKKQESLFREELTLEKVFSNLKKMSILEGTGSQSRKIKILAELFNSATSVDAKYIARIPLGSIRLGIGDPTIMDSLAIIFVEKELKKEFFRKKIEKKLKEKKEEKRVEELKQRAKIALREKIEKAYNLHSDLGEISEILKTFGIEGLKKVKIKPGVPIRQAAAERLKGAKEIIEKIGPCAVESKYDGFRLQISKDGDSIKIFSRQSEEVTTIFPEIIEGVKEQLDCKKCVVEGEALAFNENSQEYYSFQITIQRKRKYEIEKKAKEFPLKLFIFDVLCVDEENYMKKKFVDRRKKLESILKKGKTIQLSEMKLVNNEKELNDFFEEKVSQGLEGVMAKKLDAPYTAGARKYAWVKLKRSYKSHLQDSMDLTIIGYYSGKGKRTQFGLGALLVAAYNKKEDSFESIAKVGTGLTDEMLEQL